MPRTSDFVLSETPEKELVEYLLQRANSLRADNEERMRSDRESWQAYENDVKWREGDKETIFRLSNLHTPLTSMVVEYFMARAEEAVVDEAPYFDFEAIGPSDMAKVPAYNQYYNWKLDTKAKTYVTLQDGMLPIFIQRAAIFKATFDVDEKRWLESNKRILHDKTTGKPIEILDHGLIIEGEDAWDKRADPIAPDAPPRDHLRADPSFVLDPAMHEWKPVTLKRSEVLYRGPKSVQVESDRFLCPSDVVSIDAADVICENYDKGLDWFSSMWLDRPWSKWAVEQTYIKTGDASPKTGGDQKDASKESLAFDVKNPKRKVLEFWVRRDVLGWGQPQEFVIFIDEESRKAIYYEFQAKVCPDMKRPYTAIAVGKTKNRWWGTSIPEKVRQYQTESDKQLNGELYRNKIRSNPFKGGDKSRLKDPNQEITSDPDEYIELRTDAQLSEVIQFATIPDADERTQFLVDYIIRLVQLWLGVSNIAQGDYSATPENSTKYGIEATLREASKISKRWIRRILRGYEEHVLKLVQIAMATLDKNATETYEFMEGKNRMLGTLTAAEIRSVEVNVKLRMRQHRDEKDIQRAETALTVQERYMATPVQLQSYIRPLLVEILQALHYKNTDELLPIMAPVEPVMPPPAGGDQTSELAAPAAAGAPVEAAAA